MSNVPSVAILGPGLIGGSLALALAARGTRLALWTRRKASLDALHAAFPDAVLTTNPSLAVREADIVVLCCPIGAMDALSREFAPSLKPDAVVTDAGSVKSPVVRSLEPVLGGRFVGAHPMAGSEESGLAAARADLFHGATCIVTPTSESQPEAVHTTTLFWRGVGCQVVGLAPDIHDSCIARVSHLPHAVAALLTATIAQSGVDVARLAGGGYRDTTRIAAGPAAMWAEILLSNRDEMVAGLREFRTMLDRMLVSLETNNHPAVEALLDEARRARLAVAEASQGQ